jgi:hypothetical protein
VRLRGRVVRLLCPSLVDWEGMGRLVIRFLIVIRVMNIVNVPRGLVPV